MVKLYYILPSRTILLENAVAQTGVCIILNLDTPIINDRFCADVTLRSFALSVNQFRGKALMAVFLLFANILLGK